MKFFKSKDVKNAVYIGLLCSFSYLSVYIARNVLGVVTPQMIEEGFSVEYMGRVSSLYFIVYAVGQLVNGAAGDRIKAKYMVCGGLFLAAATNVLFPLLCASHPDTALVTYGMMGFFLAMIYGPLMKVIAENVKPVYAPRCSFGYTFASFLGTPLAGVLASLFVWKRVFFISSLSLFFMAVFCLFVFLTFEKKNIIKFERHERKKEKGGDFKILFSRGIVRMSLISMIAGVIRTTVVFWMPTYVSQHLGFSPEKTSVVFTAATFIITASAFVSIFIYERLNRNMNLFMFVMFGASAIFFLSIYFVRQPVLNIILLVAAILSSNSVVTIVYSVYCPSLKDTGMVSGVSGFIDFSSYVAASVSSTLFANAVSGIGWGGLIFVWFALMAVGMTISFSGLNKKRK